jgi:hypothetical protein
MVDEGDNEMRIDAPNESQRSQYLTLADDERRRFPITTAQPCRVETDDGQL